MKKIIAIFKKDASKSNTLANFMSVNSYVCVYLKYTAKILQTYVPHFSLPNFLFTYCLK